MKILKLAVIAIITVFVSSCNYLDIVPDERETETDAFEDRMAAQRYLYSCYSFLPQPRAGANSLDYMTGDEVITAFEHETFARFPKGTYSASDPVISYWNTFFQGLRQCYIFLNNIDLVPNLEEDIKQDYIAQTHFLIGYYHYLLLRCYGPIQLIKEEPKINTKEDDYLGRTPFDECVEFIASKFDMAAASLPARRALQAEYGLATSTAAKALKAKLYVYAASPLFNGNSAFYSDFVNVDGTPLMPLTYDASKWQKAATALKEAIDFAEANSYSLYMKDDAELRGNAYPSGVQRRLRFNIMDIGNDEIIWADARGEGAYGVQNKSMPFSGGTSWNGVAPTWAMLNRFYTKNGLPINEDPEYNKEFLNVTTISDETQGKVGQQTISFNIDREPRYYAWVAFQGGYYEVMNDNTNPAYKGAAYEGTNTSDEVSGRVICDFKIGGITSRNPSGTYRNNDYSPSGYLNKKGVSPTNTVSTGGTSLLNYPWPLIRLADLYLLYAEACVETGDLATAKEYTDKVRVRAGIPTVDESWAMVPGVTVDQNKLRDIVRQERMVEFYLENQNFWDMRRWLLAEKYFTNKHQGMNIDGTTIEEFSQLKTIDFERSFTSPMQYLLPIPNEDVNRNKKVVQNPGY